MDGAAVLAVDIGSADADLATLAPPAWLPCVVVGVSNRPTGPAPAGVDVALASCTSGAAPPGWVAVDDAAAELDRLSAAVGSAPHAAVALTQVLRLGEHLDTDAALSIESLAYSTLQCAPAFATWLASRTARSAAAVPETDPAVMVERHHDVLRITLNRPQVRNAIDRRLRDELCAALAVACADPTLRVVELRGAGIAFCSGGDLGEFGTLPDAFTAHLTRTTRSPARMLAAVADRAVAFVHGACVGAGIELAAFAGHVVATSDAGFCLPELALGLVPGAGGTVSIPRRVGRQRTAWLALTGSTIDARRARAWGLVDELAEP
jgi:Enoyl-CoA hydratase/isomerase